MAYCTLNGAPVVEATVCLPRSGAWHADLIVAKDAAPTGAVTLGLAEGRIQLKGTVLRGGAPYLTALVRVVGGAGGLQRILAPRAYRQVPRGTVLRAALSEAGESLSPNADQATLAEVLDHWVRRQAPAGELLGALLASSGASWRVHADGSVWVGPESWPPTKSADWVVLEQLPQLGKVVLSTDTPALWPGEVLRGRKVEYVEHRVDAKRIRTEVLLA